MLLLARVRTIGIWTLASRLLGLLRDRLLATSFGASPLLAAFLVAFQIPNLLRNLFGEGALSAAFIPRYVQMRERDAQAAERFSGIVLSRLALWLTALTAIATVAAMAVVIWGRADLGLIACLAIPQLSYAIFICVAALAAGVLNGRRHFAVPALAPVILNIVLIAAILATRSVWILPYAVLLAGVLQCGVHLWAMAATGSVPPCRLRGDADVRELGRAFLPTLLATGAYQLNALFDSLIAYLLVPAAGAVSYLYFGNRLLQFPLALVGHGVSTALYPEMASRAAAELGSGEPWRGSGEQLRQGSEVLLALLLPATAGLIVCAEPAVRAIFQAGAFNAEDADRTILVTQCFALSLVPIALSKLFLRLFHAHRDQAVPVRIGLATVGGNLGLNLLLVQTPLQEAGIALASSISGGAGCFAYLFLAKRRGAGELVDRRSLLFYGLASVVMAAAVATLLQLWPAAPGYTTAQHFLRLLAAIGLGSFVYFTLAGRRFRRSQRRVDKPA